MPIGLNVVPLLKGLAFPPERIIEYTKSALFKFTYHIPYKFLGIFLING